MPQVWDGIHLGALSEVLPKKCKTIEAQSGALDGPQ
jgi:hypothetical protein